MWKPLAHRVLLLILVSTYGCKINSHESRVSEVVGFWNLESTSTNLDFIMIGSIVIIRDDGECVLPEIAGQPQKGIVPCDFLVVNDTLYVHITSSDTLFDGNWSLHPIEYTKYRRDRYLSTLEMTNKHMSLILTR